MKAKGVDFMERIGESDRASEFDSMTVDQYAEHKGLTLENPTRKTRKRKRRTTKMANGFSKADLEDMVDGSGANSDRIGDHGQVPRLEPVEELFKGRHFDQEIIVLGVRWY